ncbi:transcriptional regulator [Tamlana sp. 2201CG12-4]|uniref:helix-turn-helix and ligand-binding sensor domain-containing protein n=1 Tax=Tamlana sp. 2201CG12-4 TaxID=3112582 RepID=UPI002DB65874|nr:transcriptional regulator [Tamlana sp. 2201CG12-4]MEC3905734.1 transcriptional regulator [Tamlana sp. 2201CG12-4]
MNYFKVCFFFIAIFVSFQTKVLGQFSPNFKNYSISDYEGGNKNWGVAFDSIGRVYVANNEGLLEYNGVRWKLWPMPNKTIVRSVFVDGDRIYTGSFEEFGYWERDAKGILKYTSLTQKENKLKFDQEYWQIISYNDALYFRSFTKIYVFRDNKIELIPTIGTITSCNVVNNELLIFSSRSGILKLVNNEFIPVSDIKIPNEVKVNHILPLKGSGLFISSRLNGCFVFDGKDTKPWNSEINSVIQKYELNNLLRLANGDLVFGTIKDGAYLTDKSGKILFHLNKDDGLINNTVLFQNVSKNNELWLGLDNGLASIDLKSKVEIFNDVGGDLGAVYDIVNYKNTLFIGSNTGLYYIDENREIQFVNGSQGQVWDLKVVKDNLFCGHNNGTFLVKDKQLEEISDFEGGWMLKPIIGEDDFMLQATYSGFVRYKKSSNGWDVSRVANFNLPLRYLVFEDRTTAWGAHPYKGLFKVEFDENLERVISSKNYENKGVWSTYNLKIFKVKNNIVFQTGKGWQKYEPLEDKIVPFDMLSEKIGENSFIISEEPDELLAVKEGDLIFIKPSFSSDKKYYIPNTFYKQRLVSGFERISKVNDSIYALCLMDGFMLYNESNFGVKYKLEKPIVDYIKLKDEFIDTDTADIKTSFKDNNISIEISSPNSADHFFEYRLIPSSDPLWKANDDGKIELSNLLEGKYKLALRTADANGKKSEEIILSYYVAPPWYRGVAGGVLYVCLAMILVLAMYSYNHQKLKRKQRIMKINLEKEQSILLKEKELENLKAISEVKNAALANEIKLKSKQLANTAMALVKKNEILVLLKKELIINKDKFNNRYAFNRLIKLIDKSIEHEDEWQLFEYNFNQVHKEFFEDLRSKYPALTHKDLKLCAYIKMNLSTKEIAPLLNISVRGVETHRYRLKKKFLLDEQHEGININKFLMQFSKS